MNRVIHHNVLLNIADQDPQTGMLHTFGRIVQTRSTKPGRNHQDLHDVLRRQQRCSSTWFLCSLWNRRLGEAPVAPAPARDIRVPSDRHTISVPDPTWFLCSLWRRRFGEASVAPAPARDIRVPPDRHTISVPDPQGGMRVWDRFVLTRVGLCPGCGARGRLR